MNYTVTFEPRPAETAYAGATPPKDLADLTIAQAWGYTGEDKNAMLAALVYAASQSKNRRLRRIAELGLTVEHGQGVETVLWQRPWETFHSILPHLLPVIDPDPLPAAIVDEYNAHRRGRNKTRLCHAPATSMYIGRDGLVSACCYSRANPFGRYTDQSLGDIWFGDRQREMADQVSRNVLPYGCGTCHDQLRAGNFAGLLAGLFDDAAPPPDRTRVAAIARTVTGLAGLAPRRPYPTSLEFELSNTCNLECTMCSGRFSSAIRARRENLPPLHDSYDDAFLDQLREFVPYLKHAKFHGGEPFLIERYFAIWERIAALNPDCRVSITTNGTVFSPRVERAIKGLNCHIVVSLDSLQEDTYERVRRGATLKQTLFNFGRFAELTAAPGKSLSIAVCPMTSNWRELPALVEFANKRKIEIFFNTVTYPEEASPKSWPVERLDEALVTLCAAIRAGSTVLERHNYGALNGVCRQLAMWLGQRRVPTREA